MKTAHKASRVSLSLLFSAAVSLAMCAVVHAQVTGNYVYQPSTGSTVSVNTYFSNGTKQTITIPNQNPPSILQDISFQATPLALSEGCYGVECYFSDDTTILDYVTSTGVLIPFNGYPMSSNAEWGSDIPVADYSDWISGNYYIYLNPMDSYGLQDIANTADEDAIINSIAQTKSLTVQVGIGSPLTSNTFPQNMTAPATNCVSLLGPTGSKKVVFMRSNDWNSDVGDFMSYVNQIQADLTSSANMSGDNGKYSSIASQLSFYADLRKITPGNYSSGFGSLDAVSSCGTGAYSYIILSQNNLNPILSLAVSGVNASIISVDNPPSNLTVATTTIPTSDLLSWKINSVNQTGFDVERSTAGGAFTQIATAGKTATTYTDTGLTPGTSYQYRIAGILAGGMTGYSSVASLTTQSTAAPANLTAAMSSTNVGQVNLTWSNVTGATGYSIERTFSTTTDGFIVVGTTNGSTATSYTDDLSTATITGIQDTYRVRATYSGGTYSGYSATTSVSNCINLSGTGFRKVVFQRNINLSSFLPTTASYVNFTKTVVSKFLNTEPFMTYAHDFSFYIDLSQVTFEPYNHPQSCIGSVAGTDFLPIDNDTDTSFINMLSDPKRPYVSGLTVDLTKGSFENVVLPSTIPTINGHTESMDDYSYVVIHELGHGIGKLQDEYDCTDDTNLKDSYTGYNMSVNNEDCVFYPEFEFYNPIDDLLYGSTTIPSPYIIHHASQEGTPNMFIPSLDSIMNSSASTTGQVLQDGTITRFPEHRFNIISCGFLISGILLEPMDIEHAETHWPQCYQMAQAGTVAGLSDLLPRTPAASVNTVTSKTGTNIVPNTFNIQGSGFTPTNNTVQLTPLKTTSLAPPKSLFANVYTAFGSAWDYVKGFFEPNLAHGQVTPTSSTTQSYVIPEITSSDGKTLTFTVPSTTPNGTYGVSVGAFNSPWTVTQYTITVSGNIATTTVTLPTVTLSASPTTIVTGASSTITWSSTNATTCSITENGLPWQTGTSGSASSGILTSDTTFAASCTGTGGTATASITVTGGAGSVPTFTIAASPSRIVLAGTSTVTWSSTNATSCYVLLNYSPWQNGTSGSISLSSGSLGSHTVLTESCTGPGGRGDVQTADITVLTPGIPSGYATTPVNGGTCTAGYNNLGSGTCYSATIAVAPSVSVGTPTVTSIPLSWTLGYNPGVSYYTVMQTKGGSFLATTSSSSFTLTGLSPSTQYCYTVYATVNQTIGDPSSVACATTASANASSTPIYSCSSGTLSGTNCTGATLTIMPTVVCPNPSYYSPDYTDIPYYIWCTNAARTSSVNPVSVTCPTTYVLSNYMCTFTGTVPAVTSCPSGYTLNGSLCYSNLVAIAPSVTVGAVTPTSIPLSWTLAYNPGVSYYTIFQTNGASSDTTSASSFTLTGLSPSTQYCYTVYAVVNPGGNAGYSSTPVCATTPAQPLTVSIGSVTATTTSLSWTSALSNVLRYVLTETTPSSYLWYGGSATSTILSNLSPSTHYCATISASSSSQLATTSACFTTTATPPAPPVVSLVSPFYDSIQLTWTDPDPTVTRYTVVETSPGSTTWSGTSGWGGSFTATLPHLQQGTNYCLVVVAFGTAGLTSTSTQSCVSTYQARGGSNPVILGPDGLPIVPPSGTPDVITPGQGGVAPTGGGSDSLPFNYTPPFTASILNSLFGWWEGKGW